MKIPSIGRFLLSVLLTIVAVWLIAPASASTVINGGVIGSQTWTASGSPYVVLGDVSIATGGTLRIDEGAEVRFANYDSQFSGLDASRVELVVQPGSWLEVTGTADAPVMLAAQSGTSAAIWYGIVVMSGASGANLAHVSVSHAVYGIRSQAVTGVLTLRDATLQQSTQDLYLIGAGVPSLAGEISLGRVLGNFTIGSGATFDPNQSICTLQGNLSLLNGGGLRPKVTSTTDFEQLQVTGVVQLAGELLPAAEAFTGTMGQEFILIANDGTDAVEGNFMGLPEGASFGAGGHWFRISYAGGTGNDVTLVAVPPAGCDLVVQKTGPVSVPAAAAAIDYVVTVANVGSVMAESVVLVDSLPPPLLYDSATPSQGFCIEDDGHITCELGAIEPSAMATVGIATHIEWDDFTVVNTASAASATPEENPADNFDSAVTAIIFAPASAVGSSDDAISQRVAVQPNPFQHRTRIFFRAAPGSAAELSIFDVSGRLARRLQVEVTASETVLEWDGRTESGGAAPAGVYLYELKVAGQVVAKHKAVRVR